MNPHQIFVKSAAGHREIACRSAGLDMRHRRVLILIDGAKSLDAITPLVSLAELTAIVPVLVASGFIEDLHGERPNAASAQQPIPKVTQAVLTADRIMEIKAFMTLAATTYLGLLAADVNQRIARADDVAQLRALVGYWNMALCASRRGAEFAEHGMMRVMNAFSGADEALALSESSP